MFCRHCGKEIDDTSAFCQYCGKPVGKQTINDTNDQDESKGIVRTFPKKAFVMANIILVLTLISIIMMISLKPTINLTDYINVHIEDYSTHGEITKLSIDKDRLEIDIKNKSKKVNTSTYMGLLDFAIIINDFDVKINQYVHSVTGFRHIKAGMQHFS